MYKFKFIKHAEKLPNVSMNIPHRKHKGGLIVIS